MIVEIALLVLLLLCVGTWVLRRVNDYLIEYLALARALELTQGRLTRSYELNVLFMQTIAASEMEGRTITVEIDKDLRDKLYAIYEDIEEQR